MFKGGFKYLDSVCVVTDSELGSSGKNSCKELITNTLYKIVVEVVRTIGQNYSKLVAIGQRRF